MTCMTGPHHSSRRIDTALRILFWGAAAALLLAPALAMRAGAEGVNWTAEDFVFAAVLLGIVGIAFEVTMRLSRSWTYRFAAGFAVAAGFLIVLANAAVGMIADGPNAYNLSFVGVVGLALLGAIVARFRAGYMAVVMLGAGLAHLSIAVAGMEVDQLGGIFSAGFGALWLVSAGLFRWAAAEHRG